MAVLKSSLVLSLIDNVSNRARGVGGALDRLQNQHRSLLGVSARLAAFGGAYLGMSQGWSRTYDAAADAQAQMTEIGIKAELSQTQLGVLQRRLVSMSPRVNQLTSDLRAGVDTMLTMGLGVDQAMGSIEAIGKASTATGASMTDLSGASVSAMQNLKVLSDQIPRMLDGMTSAGNAGAFEMRDMAQYFPQLTASAKSLGIEGVDGILDMAAALQIARRGAGDASSAANNMSNFLGKIMSPEVMKRFKGFGVDVTKELKRAHKQGVSPIEHFIRLVDEKTKGGQADLLGQLFGDKQVLDFVRPMISDFKDYIRIREDAERASGTVADAYAKRMADAHQKTKAFWVSIENLGTSIGANLLGPVGEMAEKFAKSLNNLDAHFTIFDSISSRMRGFLSGLGVDTGKGAIQGIHDIIFGAENASAAADKYGRLFGQFQEYGRSIRQFGEDIAKNPIVQFFKDLSPYYLDLLKWSLGFVLVAGAIRKLASALLFLSGASTVFGVLKTLAGLGGDILGLPGGKGKTPKTPTGAKPKGKVPFSPLTWGLAGISGFAWLMNEGADSLRNDPARQARDNEKSAQNIRWLKNMLGLDKPTVSPENVDAQLAAQRGTQVNPLQQAVDNSRSPVIIDSSSIAAINQPSGVQQVQVTNPQPVSVNVSNTFNITGVTSPESAADAAASRVGQAAKSAVESSFSGGGGF